jgi:putative CocE/NonD family hydrolase
MCTAQTFLKQKSLLQIFCALAMLPLSAALSRADGKITADEGKLTLSVQENEVATDTFKSDANGGSESDVAVQQGSMTLKLHMSVKAKQGRITGILAEAQPGGKFTLDVTGTKGKLVIDAKPPVVKDVALPATFYPFATMAPHFLNSIVAAYDKSKGGAQVFPIVIANVVGPQGLIQDKITLTSLGAKPRKLNGKTVPIARYGLSINTPVGAQEMEVLADMNGHVLMMSMASQKFYAVREGYKGLALADVPADPTLSKPTYAVKKETVKIAMRDGVNLAADVYRPDTDDKNAKFPVILQRTPYGREKAMEANYYAKRGYVFVAQDVRGKFDSEGEWQPFVNEARDGYDTVEWCAAQSWATGAVGMIGGSYLGFVQWAAARENSPHLKCLIPIVSPPDPFFNIPYAYGTFFLWGDVWWTAIVEGKAMNAIPKFIDLTPFKTLPVSDVDKAVLGHHVPFFQEWIRHDTNDDYWQQVNFNDKMKTMPPLPALHISGWFDGDGIGTKRNYAAMTESGHANQRLIYGPWTHAVNTSTKIGKMDFGPQAVRDLDTLYLRWFDHWLKGVKNGVEKEKPVEVFLMGRNEWRQFSAWPPREAIPTRWYLHSAGHANADKSDGRLSQSKPSATEKPDHFTYDPAKPLIPTGFEKALQASGDTEAATGAEKPLADPQVLTYTSDALPHDVIVTGPLSMHLAAASSALDTDWFAALADVGPDGSEAGLCQSIIRARFRKGFDKATLLTPGEVADYTIDLWATGNVFKKGHKIRVIVSSSFFPIYDRNLNTGDSNATTTKMIVAQQTIHHDNAHLSYIELPTLDK